MPAGKLPMTTMSGEMISEEIEIRRGRRPSSSKRVGKKTRSVTVAGKRGRGKSRVTIEREVTKAPRKPRRAARRSRASLATSGRKAATPRPAARANRRSTAKGKARSQASGRSRARKATRRTRARSSSR
jgi:hypothetical protein